MKRNSEKLVHLLANDRKEISIDSRYVLILSPSPNFFLKKILDYHMSGDESNIKSTEDEKTCRR